MKVGDNVSILGGSQHGLIESIGEDDKGRFIVVRVPLPTQMLRGLIVRTEIKDLSDLVDSAIMTTKARDRQRRGIEVHNVLNRFREEVSGGSKAPLSANEKTALKTLYECLLEEVFDVDLTTIPEGEA